MRALHKMRVALFALAATLAVAAPSVAQTFPALTGRVVDEAGVLSPSVRTALAARLETLETRTGDQVVVASVRSLEGLAIEDYANRLFRHWQLGQTTRNNGVLLLMAPTERRVRIEVGYGLEGVMPDAVAKFIIEQRFIPQYRDGGFNAGAQVGVDDIVKVLTGEGDDLRRHVASSAQPHVIELPFFVNILAITLLGGLFLVFFGAMGWLILGSIVSTLVVWGVLPKKADRHGAWRVLDPFDDQRKRGSSRPAYASGSESDWRSSSSSSDSFSGGGGLSGGGGASGNL